MVLYGICIHIIIKRKRDHCLINTVLITMLFVIVTVGLAFNTLLWIQDLGFQTEIEMNQSSMDLADYLRFL